MPGRLDEELIASGPTRTAALLLARLAHDLPRLWAAPSTTDRDRKELLRTLISEVIITAHHDERYADIEVQWEGGARTELRVPLRAPGTLEHIFDPFYTTKSTGLGMGLSICRSIIEAHGGRLLATANVPHGATLQFTLPVNGSHHAASVSVPRRFCESAAALPATRRICPPG